MTRIAALALAVGCVAACGKSPANSGGAGGDGNGMGGSGDTAGSAGTSGSGGDAGSGAGGSVGTGGTPGSGGSGTGGSVATGGAASAGKGGGSGGSMGMAGAPAIEGPGVFFSGKDMNISTLVQGDAKPGYVYNMVTPTAGNAMQVANVPKIEAVNDPALPPGTKYMLTMDAPNADTPGAWIFGWNWRMDKMPGGYWNYFDGSAYAAISFWAKTNKPMVFFKTVNYDINNLPVSEGYPSSACTTPDRTGCEPAGSAVTTVPNTWKRVIIQYAKVPGGFIQTGTVTKGFDMTTLGRIDMIAGHSPDLKMWVTGITFLTKAQLP